MDQTLDWAACPALGRSRGPLLAANQGGLPKRRHSDTSRLGRCPTVKWRFDNARVRPWGQGAPVGAAESRAGACGGRRSAIPPAPPPLGATACRLSPSAGHSRCICSVQPAGGQETAPAPWPHQCEQSTHLLNHRRLGDDLTANLQHGQKPRGHLGHELWRLVAVAPHVAAGQRGRGRARVWPCGGGKGRRWPHLSACRDCWSWGGTAEPLPLVKAGRVQPPALTSSRSRKGFASPPAAAQSCGSLQEAVGAGTRS